MPKPFAKLRLLATGVLTHEPFEGGLLPRSSQALHAAEAFFAHQIASDIDLDSGRRIGKTNV